MEQTKNRMCGSGIKRRRIIARRSRRREQAGAEIGTGGNEADRRGTILRGVRRKSCVGLIGFSVFYSISQN